MTDRYSAVLRGIRNQLIADSNVTVSRENIFIQKENIDIATINTNNMTVANILFIATDPIPHGSGGFMEINIDVAVDILIADSKSEFDYISTKNSLMRSAYYIEQALQQNSLSGVVEWMNYTGTEQVDDETYTGYKALRCTFKCMILEQMTLVYPDIDINRLIDNGYTNAFKLLPNLIAGQTDVTIPEHCIFVEINRDDYVTKCVSEHPSAFIYFDTTLNEINATGSKFSENKVGFYIDIVQRPSTSEFDYIGDDRLYENACGIERAIQWNTLISAIITPIYCGMTDLYADKFRTYCNAQIQDSAVTSKWVSTERTEDYEGMKAVRLKFEYLEQRGIL